MNTPKRIQRKRTKGWRKPENTINVCRPGKWGNPFVSNGGILSVDARKQDRGWLAMGLGTVEDSVRWYESLLSGKMIKGEYQFSAATIQALLYWSEKLSVLPVAELKGKNLMCFCKNSPCHADVLLRIANEHECTLCYDTGWGGGVSHDEKPCPRRNNENN